jgi:hypothetical protein
MDDPRRCARDRLQAEDVKTCLPGENVHEGPSCRVHVLLRKGGTNKLQREAWGALTAERGRRQDGG